MTDRWRGRRLAGLAAAVAAAVAIAFTAATAPRGRALLIRDADGAELARVVLSDDGFGLRYRNSLYGSLVEERYRVDGDGLRLVELAADERAVLEEYYAAFDARHGGRGSARAWTVAVEAEPIALPLHVQATRLGQRTLLVDGSAVPLWELVTEGGDTSVTLSLEGS